MNKLFTKIVAVNGRTHETSKPNQIHICQRQQMRYEKGMLIKFTSSKSQDSFIANIQTLCR